MSAVIRDCQPQLDALYGELFGAPSQPVLILRPVENAFVGRQRAKI